MPRFVVARTKRAPGARMDAGRMSKPWFAPAMRVPRSFSDVSKSAVLGAPSTA